jgi:hypothetical protein
MQDQVHMVMGKDEARIIGTALGLMLTMIEGDIQDWQDKGEQSQNEFMAMLSMKFSAADMFSGIWNLLGVPEEDIEGVLMGLEEDDE